MNGKPDSTIKTIALVHGGFVDGSGWEEVYKILKKDGRQRFCGNEGNLGVDRKGIVVRFGA